MVKDASFVVTLLSEAEIVDHLSALAGLLQACVAAGASINFVLPYSQADAERYWRETVLPGVRDGDRAVLAARQSGRIVGSVRLDTKTPPNQPHRAEVSKLMVHPESRGQGIARAMMMALEELAGLRGRSLITLDTRTGDAAERLYAGLGYHTVGVIPGHSRDAITGHLDPTTVMYKTL